jgi:predicted  nucleic acid-binding Zn-ribbon protein
VNIKRLCLRCGAVNEASKGAATEACPCCGILYTRAAPRPAEPPVKKEAEKMPTLARLGWIGALVGASAGLVQIIVTHDQAESAPQQAAGMAMALAYTVIPYCIARALAALGRK